MSFILDALKKSENNHRRKSDQRSSRSIHEPAPRTKSKVRPWALGLCLLLLMNVALLLLIFNPWEKSSSQTPELLSTAMNAGETAIREPVNFQSTSVGRKNNPAAIPAVVSSPPQEQKKQPVAQALPVLRNEKQIYNFSQLPISIQKKIPTLQMSLHAYNRDDASASMVQLNDRIMREGDMVADNIRLEQITAEGVVLRYDGYRFLVPRRRN
ncbi:MAG: general secretion pathway protein GspB [Desulfuromusa sp.]